MSDRSIDVVNRTTVFKGFVSLVDVELRYEKRDGEMSDVVHRLSVERGDSVAVLVWVRKTHELVFVRQLRYPTLRQGEPWLTEIVAGAIDKGETPEYAALRELDEEVGIRLSSLTPISQFFGSPGSLSEQISIYFAEVETIDHERQEGGLPGEDLEIVSKPVHQVYEELITGKIHDGKTQVALFWFFLLGPGKS